MLNAKVFFCTLQREHSLKSLKNNFHDLSADPKIKSFKISQVLG